MRARCRDARQRQRSKSTRYRIAIKHHDVDDHRDVGEEAEENHSQADQRGARPGPYRRRRAICCRRWSRRRGWGRRCASRLVRSAGRRAEQRADPLASDGEAAGDLADRRSARGITDRRSSLFTRWRRGGRRLLADLSELLPEVLAEGDDRSSDFEEKFAGKLTSSRWSVWRASLCNGEPVTWRGSVSWSLHLLGWQRALLTVALIRRLQRWGGGGCGGLWRAGP